MVEPHESDASFAVAVEVHQPHATHPFGAGLATGFALAALLVQAYFIHAVTPYRQMYREFVGAEMWVHGQPLPPLTALVISPVWLWGVPVAGALGIAAVVWRRPRALWPYLVVAGALVATVVVTWAFFDAPIAALAGNIKG
jgi:hypothetical protein